MLVDKCIMIQPGCDMVWTTDVIETVLKPNSTKEETLAFCR